LVEPILVSIAAALAARSATALYDLVRRRFAGREEPTAALEAADGTPRDSPEVATLADHLAAEEAADPAFRQELRQTWQRVIVTDNGLVNQIYGDVSGKVVQARDIEGDISL
jgi:hypothetical protein